MKKHQAFTLLELLIVISIIAIMASLALPHLLSALTKGEMMQTASNARQLYLATQSMAIDANTSGDNNLGWPGDMSSPSFSAWATALCSGYLSKNEFCKLCSAPGVLVSSDHFPTSASQSAFHVYAVKEESEGNAIFLITRNATAHENGSSISITLDNLVKPYGNKGCVIMHRGGDALSIMQNQVKNSQALGTIEKNLQLE